MILVFTAAVICMAAVLNLSEIKGYFGWDNGQNQNAANELIKQQAREEAAQQGLLILVNKQHPVDKSFKPDDLTKMKYFVSDREEITRYMRAAAVPAFNLLVEKAAEDGIVLKMTTAYRSYAFQEILYNNYVSQYGEEEANRFSAKPGKSEHQTGLAVDVSAQSVDYQLTEEFGETLEGKWLAAHSHEFGFIIRYPKGKEDLTGYSYEPWHLRYVGLSVANEVYEEGVTLEEYLLEYDIK